MVSKQEENSLRPTMHGSLLAKQGNVCVAFGYSICSNNDLMFPGFQLCYRPLGSSCLYVNNSWVLDFKKDDFCFICFDSKQQ